MADLPVGGSDSSTTDSIGSGNQDTGSDDGDSSQRTTERERREQLRTRDRPGGIPDTSDESSSDTGSDDSDSEQPTTDRERREQLQTRNRPGGIPDSTGSTGTGSGGASSPSTPDDINQSRRNNSQELTGGGTTDQPTANPDPDEQPAAPGETGLGDVPESPEAAQRQAVSSQLEKKFIRSNTDISNRSQVDVTNVRETDDGNYTGDITLTDAGREAVQEANRQDIQRMGTTGRFFADRQVDVRRQRAEAAVADDVRTNQFARERLREQIADESGQDAANIDLDVTETGFDVALTEGGEQRDIVAAAADNSEFSASDVTTTTGEDGTLQPELTESAREEATRDDLRERAESEYPNAEDITITEEQGELVAEIERENNVQQTVRYAQNFAADPVSATLEGGGDIYSGLASDTSEFVSGRVEGVQNPGETFDWAVSGVTENTIDPTASAVDTVVSDPVGVAEGAVDDAAGGVVSLAEGGANASAGLVESGVTAVQDFDLQEDTPGGSAGAALLGGAVVSPIPGDEVAVGAGLAGLAAGGAVVAGGDAAVDEVTRNPETTLAPPGVTNELDVSDGDARSEVDAPASPGLFGDSELSVNEDTGVVQREVGLPEDVSGEDVEVRVPDSVDESVVTTGEGEVSIPAELTPVVVSGSLRSEEEEEDEDEEEDEEEEDEDAEDEEVAEDEIVIELPEDSPYSPDEILAPEEQATERTEREAEEGEQDAEDGQSLEELMGEQLRRYPLQAPGQAQSGGEVNPEESESDGAFEPRDSGTRESQRQDGDSVNPNEQNDGASPGDVVEDEPRSQRDAPAGLESVFESPEFESARGGAAAVPVFAGLQDDDATATAARPGQREFSATADADLSGALEADAVASADATADAVAVADATADLTGELTVSLDALGESANMPDLTQPAPTETTTRTRENTTEPPRPPRPPRPPSEPSRRPMRLPEIPGSEPSEDEDRGRGMFSTAQLTDFVDPLSGGVLETNLEE